MRLIAIDSGHILQKTRDDSFQINHYFLLRWKGVGRRGKGETDVSCGSEAFPGNLDIKHLLQKSSQRNNK